MPEMLQRKKWEKKLCFLVGFAGWSFFWVWGFFEVGGAVFFLVEVGFSLYVRVF